METVAPPPAEVELQFLKPYLASTGGWRGSLSRNWKAPAGSLLVNALLVLAAMVIPAELMMPPPPSEVPVKRVTPLVEPLTVLTQKDPTKGKIAKEFAAEQKPKFQAPVAPPAAPPPPPQEARASRPLSVPPMPTPKPATAPPVVEPPRVDALPKVQPRADLPALPVAPPPQIQAEEKPKSPFEGVPGPAAPPAKGRSAVPIPDTSVGEAIRGSIRGQGGGLVLGDPKAAGPGSQQTVGPQILSDTMGVDFRPYLTQILATVRRNWQAVWPESVRQGRQGKVSIVFSIDRNGGVPKLVIANYSGAEALDRAAIAGISASTPFPPLPSEFKGPQIVLQFNFAYNMPKQ